MYLTAQSSTRMSSSSCSKRSLKSIVSVTFATASLLISISCLGLVLLYLKTNLQLGRDGQERDLVITDLESEFDTQVTNGGNELEGAKREIYGKLAEREEFVMANYELEDYLATVERQHRYMAKYLRTNRGGEGEEGAGLLLVSGGPRKTRFDDQIVEKWAYGMISLEPRTLRDQLQYLNAKYHAVYNSSATSVEVSKKIVHELVELVGFLV